MHQPEKVERWWYNDDQKTTPIQSRSPPRSKRNAAGGDRKWRFQVVVTRDLLKEEKIAITGDCEALGSWQPHDVVILDPDNDDENTWSIEIELPNDREIKYRYLVCSVDPHTEGIHVRHWETHVEPRFIKPSSPEDASTRVDTFGEVNGLQKVDRGWLTTETIIQFKFFNNPFNLKDRVKNKQFYVKVTPINMRAAENSSFNADDSISNDTRDNASDQPAYAFSEVATLSDAERGVFAPQEQFGRLYRPNDYLVINVSVSEPENVAYIVDLYTHSSKAQEGDPPYHFGYHYILPNVLRKSDGKLELYITCATRHRPLGIMRADFLKITSLPPGRCDLSRSYARYWNNKFTGLDVGHRGSGTSFKANDGNVIRENTIASLKKAAEHGADMVEFDVQLSKDLVPVIYHDFYVYVSLRKKANGEMDMLELAMKDLTLSQLKDLKVFHSAEGKSREQKFFDEHLDDHQPFPELSEALEVLDPNVGFNVEIKWGQELEDGSHEASEATTDRNLYLDCILEVVLTKAKGRRIVFSCFDADICVMLRYKQNLYPVMFLTCGVTKRYTKYREPRCSTVEYAVKNACCMELLGIVAHTEDLLRDSSQIKLAKDNGLIIFCWGEDNNCQDTIKRLKSLGIHGVIYDKMDVYSTKGAKENMFSVHAGSNQASIMQQIQIESDQSQSTNSGGESSLTNAISAMS